MDSENNPIVGRYIQKPIEACLVTRENIEKIAEWCNGDIYYENEDNKESSGEFNISKGERTISADIGDYIIKASSGGFYKVDGESFRSLYEQIWWEEPND